MRKEERLGRSRVVVSDSSDDSNSPMPAGNAPKSGEIDSLQSQINGVFSVIFHSNHAAFRCLFAARKDIPNEDSQITQNILVQENLTAEERDKHKVSNNEAMNAENSALRLISEMYDSSDSGSSNGSIPNLGEIAKRNMKRVVNCEVSTLTQQGEQENESYSHADSQTNTVNHSNVLQSSSLRRQLIHSGWSYWGNSCNGQRTRVSPLQNRDGLFKNTREPSEQENAIEMWVKLLKMQELDIRDMAASVESQDNGSLTCVLDDDEVSLELKLTQDRLRALVQANKNRGQKLLQATNEALQEAQMQLDLSLQLHPKISNEFHRLNSDVCETECIGHSKPLFIPESRIESLYLEYDNWKHVLRSLNSGLADKQVEVVTESTNKGLSSAPVVEAVTTTVQKEQATESHRVVSGVTQNKGIKQYSGQNESSANGTNGTNETKDKSDDIRHRDGVSGEKEEEEDEVVCGVCFDGESTEQNAIVYCDKCNIPLHQACYGIASVPEGDFFCDRCFFAMTSELEVGDVSASECTCLLCPWRDGPMKRAIVYSADVGLGKEAVRIAEEAPFSFSLPKVVYDAVQSTEFKNADTSCVNDLSDSKSDSAQHPYHGQDLLGVRNEREESDTREMGWVHAFCALIHGNKIVSVADTRNMGPILIERRALEEIKTTHTFATSLKALCTKENHVISLISTDSPLNDSVTQNSIEKVQTTAITATQSTQSAHQIPHVEKTAQLNNSCVLVESGNSFIEHLQNVAEANIHGDAEPKEVSVFVSQDSAVYGDALDKQGMSCDQNIESTNDSAQRNQSKSDEKSEHSNVSHSVTSNSQRNFQMVSQQTVLQQYITSQVKAVVGILTKISICSLCRVPQGVCTKCSCDNCDQHFHPLCAWFAGFKFTTDFCLEDALYESGTGVTIRIYCPLHNPTSSTTREPQQEFRHKQRLRLGMSTPKELEQAIVSNPRKGKTQHNRSVDMLQTEAQAAAAAAAAERNRRKRGKKVGRADTQFEESGGLRVNKQKVHLMPPDQYEEGMCAVCFEFENQDDMIRCDGCRLLVHRNCYGLSPTLELTNEWKCRACRVGVKFPECLLCPRRGGALTMGLKKDTWVHVMCALWTPG